MAKNTPNPRSRKAPVSNAKPPSPTPSRARSRKTPTRASSVCSTRSTSRAVSQASGRDRTSTPLSEAPPLPGATLGFDAVAEWNTSQRPTDPVFATRASFCAAEVAVGQPIQPPEHCPPTFFPPVSEIYGLLRCIPAESHGEAMKVRSHGINCIVPGVKGPVCHKACLPAFIYTAEDVNCRRCQDKKVPTIIWQWYFLADGRMCLRTCWFYYTRGLSHCTIKEVKRDRIREPSEAPSSSTVVRHAATGTSRKRTDSQANFLGPPSKRLSVDTAGGGQLSDPFSLNTQSGHASYPSLGSMGGVSNELSSVVGTPTDPLVGTFHFRTDKDRSSVPTLGQQRATNAADAVPSHQPKLRLWRQYRQESRSRGASDSTEPNIAASLSEAPLQAEVLPPPSTEAVPPPHASNAPPELQTANTETMVSAPEQFSLPVQSSVPRPDLPAQLKSLTSEVLGTLSFPSDIIRRTLKDIEAAEMQSSMAVNSLLDRCEAVWLQAQVERLEVDGFRAEKAKTDLTIKALERRLVHYTSQLKEKDKELAAMKKQQEFFDGFVNDTKAEQAALDERISEAIVERDQAFVDRANALSESTELRRSARQATTQRDEALAAQQKAELAMDDAFLEISEAKAQADALAISNQSLKVRIAELEKLLASAPESSEQGHQQVSEPDFQASTLSAFPVLAPPAIHPPMVHSPLDMQMPATNTEADGDISQNMQAPGAFNLEELVPGFETAFDAMQEMEHTFPGSFEPRTPGRAS